MTDSTAEERVNTSLFDSLADDTLTVFKLIMTVLVLYGSILALLAREGSNEFVIRTLGSLYTNLGIQFLLGSLLAVGLLYGWLRVRLTYEEYPNKWLITDEQVATYALISTVLGTVLAVFLLVAGILDGASAEGIPVTQFPVLFFPIIFVIAIFDLLVLPHLLPRFGQTAREYVSALRQIEPETEVADSNQTESSDPTEEAEAD